MTDLLLRPSLSVGVAHCFFKVGERLRGCQVVVGAATEVVSHSRRHSKALMLRLLSEHGARGMVNLVAFLCPKR